MKTIILLLAIVIQVNTTLAQSEDKVYSVFVLNFAKYVQWPEGKTSEDFVIGVIGTTTVGDYLKTVAALKTVGNQKISLKYCRSLQEVSGCHLLFVAEDKSSMFPEIVSKLSNEPTLLVTEKPGLAKNGGGISFAQANGKVKFEINVSAIESRGMKVASALSSLGTIVGD